MRFDLVTLFPDLFAPFVKTGVVRRAFESGQIEFNCHNPRDFASGPYRRVDDRPFGGGPGMVMLAQPLAQCVRSIAQQRGDQAPVVLFSPVGRTLTHASVQAWAQSQGAILLCGRYEGVDQRLIDTLVTEQISLGDFVLSGGEIAAMALLDAVARLLPGVLGDAASHAQDSFHPDQDGLLDCPQFTRPEVWQDMPVPAVLMSGHHANIAQWRREQRLALTARHRPDLIEKARASGALSPHDDVYLRAL